MTILIGQGDGLLHQLRQSYTGMGSIIETHRDIRVNPVLSPETWRWTPPQGLKPVENFAALQPDRYKPINLSHVP